MISYFNFALFYDSLTDNVNYSATNEYICGILLRHGISDGILLDLACGTGSMSVEFAKKGYEVIGVDASAQMLCVAREKAIEASQQVLFICQKMEELDLYGTIKACVCSLDSLNHLTEEKSIEKTIQNVSLFMEKDGIFVFDVNSIYKHKNILADNCFVIEKEDVFAVWQNEYDSEDESVDISLDFFSKQGKLYHRDHEEFSERAYSVEYLSAVLENNHFEIMGIYDDLSNEKYKPNSERIYFVARKKNGQTC